MYVGGEKMEGGRGDFLVRFDSCIVGDLSRCLCRIGSDLEALHANIIRLLPSLTSIHLCSLHLTYHRFVLLPPFPSLIALSLFLLFLQHTLSPPVVFQALTVSDFSAVLSFLVYRPPSSLFRL